MHCRQCGKANTERSNFCRYCGTKFGPSVRPPARPDVPPQDYPQRQQDLPIEQRTPRPYAWKTDELEFKESSARQTSQIEDMAIQPAFGDRQMTRPLAGQTGLAEGYRCPRCGAESLPYTTRKVSSAGWIVFAVLLVFFFPLFWVGLLMKEDVLVCPACDCRVN